MTIREQLIHSINSKTKPLGALGVLETVALQIGLIQGTASPEIIDPQIIVFAGDHGIAVTGLVDPLPQEVTAQMALNFLEGGGAINVFTRQHNIGLTVVDAGINCDFHPGLYDSAFLNYKIDRGTKNYLKCDAMTDEEALTAIQKGKAVISTFSSRGCNTVGFGDIGIGNTSSAALIMSAVTGIPIEECVGKGTGLTHEQLLIKIATLKGVFAKHRLREFGDAPIELLSKVGGFEIAMMAGAYVQAARLRMLIVVDGFAATAALLIARMLDETVRENCIFAHSSSEQGHDEMLSLLHARPLLNLGLRIGEGAGAALAIPLIQSAVGFLNEMASSVTANISQPGE